MYIYSYHYCYYYIYINNIEKYFSNIHYAAIVTTELQYDIIYFRYQSKKNGV